MGKLLLVYVLFLIVPNTTWETKVNKEVHGLKAQPIKDFILGSSPIVNRKLLTHILTKNGSKKGVLHENSVKINVFSLHQRVLSVTSDIVNIIIVIVCNKKELIIIVYKLKYLCTINKIMSNTIIMLKFLVTLLIMYIKFFRNFK